MSFRARIQPILVFLCLTVLALQGCSVDSGGGGEGGAGAAADGGAINLDLTTTTGVFTLVSDGVDSLVLQLTVTDGSGNGISGSEVHFTTTAGSLAPDMDTTNADGVATATLTSSTTVETATVIAEVLGFSQALRISFVSGVPASLTVNAVPNGLEPGQTTTVQAIVRDADGIPVQGVTVSLSVPTNNSGGRLNPTSGTTGTSGAVVAEYTAGNTLGTDVVRGDIGSLSDTAEIEVRVVEIVPSKIELFVSSPQMDSDGSETVTLTAVVSDDNNNLVSGVDVAFSSDSGELKVISNTTDDSGIATAELTSKFDPSNRTITVEAAAGTLVATNTVEVTGTTIALSGNASLVLNETTVLSVLLRNSAGDGIAGQVVNITSFASNPLFDLDGNALQDSDGDSNPDVTTDDNGQATFEVRADNVDPTLGGDIITVSALNTSASLDLSISTANFRFTAPDAGTEVNLGVNQTITVHWDEAGVPQVGQTINFFVTRGTLSAASAVTDANGNASVTISSTTAGPSVITAAANVAGGPSSQRSILFVATNPTSLVLQADPTTIGVNSDGSTAQQSIITAIVRDPAGNLVKNQTVSFTLTDQSGGFIFPASAVTDSFGRASTVYTAGPVASAKDGVIIDAAVAGLAATVRLTVAEQELFIILGTGNLVQTFSPTQYAKTYTALVTDAAGNPRAGETVELNLLPTRYQKGFYVQVFDENGTFVTWAKSLSIDSLSGFADDTDRACNNEDNNLGLDPSTRLNGVLDPGEDINENGKLDPRNVASVPATVTTDANGFASFDIIYTRDMTWVEVQLEARVPVVGSEATTQVTFFLPGVVSDFNNKDVAPPGAVSPFGTATTCDCDESVDPMCSSITNTGSVRITPNSAILPAGDSTTGPFSISGGVEQTYTVTTTTGTLTNTVTNEQGTVISVAFGEFFTLTTTAADNGSTITVVATDDITSQAGAAIILKNSPPAP